jgi:hypothetical protein
MKQSTYNQCLFFHVLMSNNTNVARHPKTFMTIKLT